MSLDWRSLGFAAEPALVGATGDEKLYRAWGGTSSKLGTRKRGVFFSLDRARSRADAEMLYSVMEWNNAVFFLTEFSVEAGTPIWVGKVHPGDLRAALGSYSGRQVFIEPPHVARVRGARTEDLAREASNVLAAGRTVRGRGATNVRVASAWDRDA